MDCVRHLGHCGEQKRTSIQPLPCPYEKKDRERKKNTSLCGVPILVEGQRQNNINKITIYGI